MKVKTPTGFVEVTPNIIDRVVSTFNPVAGKQRFQARVQMAAAGAYDGGSRSKRSQRNYVTTGGSADADLLPDLAEMRNRSRDQERNNPVAAGAINTAVTSTIGTGLKMEPSIDRDYLGLDEDAADAWEANTEREFNIWAESIECDAARTLNFYQQQPLAFRSALSNGDALYMMPMFKRKGSPYQLKLQAVETDRLVNESNQADNDKLAGGVQVDKYGAPVTYHIMDQHPGSISRGSATWTKVAAFGSRSGRRNVIHLFEQKRPGQRRGVPYLAPVLDSLKQISRYTEAELMAAVVSGMFTVFVKSQGGETTLGLPNNGETQDSSTPDDLELGNGAIVSLAEDEDVSIANPGRPNPNFDPFFMSIIRQIGAALEIPHEVLLKSFTASYSASKAAFLEAWRFFKNRRVWMATSFCQPIYEMWLEEAIAIGRIEAPGFFTDPAIRAAYSGCEWFGDAQGDIDETKAADSAERRVRIGVSTIARESRQINGSDWKRNFRQRVKEYNMRKEAGLLELTDNPEDMEIDDGLGR